MISCHRTGDFHFTGQALSAPQNNQQGTSIKGITKDDLLSKVISVPKSMDEQAHIGALFKDLDNLITLHQRERTA